MKPKQIPAPGHLATLGFGVLAGVALGSAEGLWRLGNVDAALLRYTMFWYGVLGAVYFGLAGCIARLAIQREWYSASYSARPPMAGGLVALGLPVVAIYQSVHLFAEQLPTTRLILFFMVLAVSGLAGWCVARGMAARPGMWLARWMRFLWKPWPLALGLLGLSVFCSARILGQDAGAGIVLAADETAGPGAGGHLVWIQVRGLGAGAGITSGTASAPSLSPQLDAFARQGIAFSRAIDHPLPSLPWPWPLSLLEPWLRSANRVDPDLPRTTQRDMLMQLKQAGFRCRALGDPTRLLDNPGFQDPDHDQRERERKLLLSHLIGRCAGALGAAKGPRAAPALETWFPIAKEEQPEQTLSLRVRALAWPSKKRREFLHISLELPTGGLPAADAELGQLLADLRREGHLERALVVVTAWPKASQGPTVPLQQRPLIVVGPGLTQGKQIHAMVSLDQLPQAALAQLGVGNPNLEGSPANQLLEQLQGQ